jgi:molybdopterin synthase sulfur carrier subunit
VKLTVRYFAAVREALGVSEVLEVEPGATVGAVRDALIALDARHAAALGRDRAIRGALNQVLCAEDAAVGADAEVGFFPPVTGG